MYIYIRTDIALQILSEYLREKEKDFRHYNAHILIEALGIAMKNSIAKFGNMFK